MEPKKAGAGRKKKPPTKKSAQVSPETEAFMNRLLAGIQTEILPDMARECELKRDRQPEKENES